MKQDEGLAMLTRAIEAARAIDPEAAAFLADGLHLVRSGSARSLDLALGIRGRGIASIATREQEARRNAHLIAAFQLVPFDEFTTTTARVRELAEAIADFQAITWKWSQHHEAPPRRLTALQEHLWRAHRCGRVPTSPTQIGRIVTGTNHEIHGFDGCEEVAE